jgi:hypothetical protein
MLKHKKWGACSVKTSQSGIVTLLEKGIKLEAYTLRMGRKWGACTVKKSESGIVALLETGSKLEAYTLKKRVETGELARSE